MCSASSSSSVRCSERTRTGLPEVQLKVKAFLVVFAAILCGLPAAATAQSKIGFVDSDRLMREAGPAVGAQKRLEKEFELRDQELQSMAKRLTAMQEELDRNTLTMSDGERREKEREINELSRDLNRKNREFLEDLNQRRNEELAMVLESANEAVKRVAEAEKYDVILQDVVYASPGIDITDKVIKALGR